MKKQLTIEEHQANYEKFVSTFQKKADILHYLDNLHLLFIASKEREDEAQIQLMKKGNELRQVEVTLVTKQQIIKELNYLLDTHRENIKHLSNNNLDKKEEIINLTDENQFLKEQLEHAQYRLVNLMMALTTPTKDQLSTNKANG